MGKGDCAVKFSNAGRSAGFTLIEVMIVVAIVAILASIALPAYNAQIVKSRRVDVQRLVVTRAQDLERYFSTNGRYVTAAGGTTCGGSDPSSAYYTVAAGSCTDTTFTITATPISGSSQVGDGNQTLDQTGARTGTWKY